MFPIPFQFLKFDFKKSAHNARCPWPSPQFSHIRNNATVITNTYRKWVPLRTGAPIWALFLSTPLAADPDQTLDRTWVHA
jgi:hypothetical protein